MVVLAQSKHAAEPALVEVKNLSLEYREQQNVVLAVWRLNFSIQSGDRLVVMGRSGCGKSTLLKAIAGFLTPRDGQILFNGEAIEGPSAERFVVWQNTEQLLPWKNVLDNVALPLKLKSMSREAAREQAAYWLNKVGLFDNAKLYPHQLSGGMKMRAAVARAFAAQPKLLLMDEPFAALDALTRQQMQDLLLQLQEEMRTTCFFVSHDIVEASRIATRILLMSPHPGQVKAEISNLSREDDRLDLQTTLHRLLFDQGHC